MLLRPIHAVEVICIAAIMLSGCNSHGDLKVRGNVTIDGKPVEMGTIHFSPAEDANARGVGAAISNGAFELQSDRGLSPGDYNVSLQAFKTTGRMISDPQRGQIAEKSLLNAMDSPQLTKLSAQNAAGLKLSFSTSRPH